MGEWCTIATDYGFSPLASKVPTRKGIVSEAANAFAMDSFPLTSEVSTRKGIVTETTLQHPWEFNSMLHVQVREEERSHQELVQGMEGCCQSGFVDQLCYC